MSQPKINLTPEQADAHSTTPSNGVVRDREPVA